jgi:hypothetical protein
VVNRHGLAAGLSVAFIWDGFSFGLAFGVVAALFLAARS